ncbi:MAG: SsrA-binding protein SmpB [Clostridiaceae bacterium]|nr:SsrA-binding protein SmpB [Clostridiaceae bacterium]
MSNNKIKTIINNKKARHDFHILESYEAGIELLGKEVKSIRQGKVNLKESYAQIEKGEVWLVGMHISPYEQAGQFNDDPVRKRKLLLHKREIRKLEAAVQQQGLTLIPTKLYFKNSLVKVELSLAKGKKLYDKRDDLKRKEIEKQIKLRLDN